MSMWSDYLKEREGKEVLEFPDDGFIVYKVNQDKTCYIEHIYVVPNKRGLGVASMLCDEVEAKAKEAGCTHLLGSVSPSAPGATHSLRVQLTHGFSLDRATENFILLSKEIK